VKSIFYNLRFSGKVCAANGEAETLRTIGTATSCVQSILIGPAGLESDVKPLGGDLAFLESAVHFTGPASFEEHGTITFGSGDEHELRFLTLGSGQLTLGPVAGSVAGMARWKIEGGRGQFAGAEGFIASSFTWNDSGQLDELHSGLILLR
jgi:hypothetical protein